MVMYLGCHLDGSMARFRFGCSGWDYQEWIGPFYRNASESKLRAYARVFDTAEINSTFYRAPSPGMVQGWGRFTPDDFIFAAKVPQTVTHDRLLDVAAGAEEELKTWVQRVQQVASQSETVYGFFNNHFHGYAPENCIQILRMLGVQTQDQARALQRIEGFRKQATHADVRLKSLTLEDFGADVPKDALVDAALGRLMDPNRLDRAKRIDSKDVEVTRDGELILARVKEYRIELDPMSKTIVHDCEDWGKLSGRKDFCKHVGKFFLSLPKEEALTRLNAIATDRDAWTFSTPPT